MFGFGVRGDGHLAALRGVLQRHLKHVAIVPYVRETAHVYKMKKLTMLPLTIFLVVTLVKIDSAGKIHDAV